MRDLAERCGGCGRKKRDWEEDHFAYVGHVERCPWCEVLAEEQENVDNAAKMGQNTKGLRIGLIPRAQAEALEQAGAMDPLSG